MLLAVCVIWVCLERCLLKGGLPITVVKGEFVGAIGVSGVRSHQDAKIAQAGIDGLV